MSRALRIAGGFLVVLAGVAALVLLALRIRYGGGGEFPDRSGPPLLAESALEVVADLPLPPGNIAVSSGGRVFFTFHPEAGPEIKVAELIDGVPVPYPDAAAQAAGGAEPWFDTPLALRIDSQDRLWVLDYGAHGMRTPKLLAFDLATNTLVDQFAFPAEIAGAGSMLNDFQVSPDGKRIYIADASIFRNRGAIVVYDVEKRAARRLLDGDESVQAEPYVPRVRGRDMVVFGVFVIRPNVDSIALDKRGEWLYFAAVTADELHRVRTSDLDDESLSAEDLAARVEGFAEKTMSDGLTMDLRDNVYVTDMEHDAIHRIGPDRKLETLLASKRIRWPDGMSFGPDGWLYLTASSLQDVIFMPRSHVEAKAPYQIFRFRPGAEGVPGQ
jgi:sugar lactone lactonase YvrE